MIVLYKLIPEVFTEQNNWSAKIFVTRKQAPKNVSNATDRYQKKFQMDLVGFD